MTKEDRQNLTRTAALLAARAVNRKLEQHYGTAADDAQELHAIATKLHRWSERQCNEDLTCPACGGDGKRLDKARSTLVECRACAGHGTTIGRREERQRKLASETAAKYGMRAYFQSDPRGCPLYLIPEEIVPDAAELARVDVSHACSQKAAEYLRTAEAWIDCNYTRGHAVAWVGR